MNFITNGLNTMDCEADFALHKVNYTLTDKENKRVYQSSLTETPAKAAAKINLFMIDPDFMPKK